MSDMQKHLENQLSHLCEICRVIDFKSYVIQASLSPPPEKGVHLGYLDDIIGRASFCEFCALLISCARRINNGEDVPTTFYGQRVKVQLAPEFFCMVDNLELDDRDVPDKVDINRLRIDFQPAIFSYFSKLRFQLYKEAEVPGFGRLIHSAVDPIRLKGWLHQCEETHGDGCHAPVV